MTYFELMQLRKLSEDDRIGIEVIPASEAFGPPVSFLKCLVNKEYAEDPIPQKRGKKDKNSALNHTEVSAVMMESDHDEGHKK